jgi:hypothetical protein
VNLNAPMDSLRPIRPIWRNQASRSSGIGASVIVKIRSVIPHEVLGQTLYLNFKKIMEDAAEQKGRKCT